MSVKGVVETELFRDLKMDGFIKEAVDKFVEYAKIDTQSKELENDDNLSKGPSTPGQGYFCGELYAQLLKMGLEVKTGKTGYVYACLKSNIEDGKKYRKVGFAAHVDTSGAASGKDVKPIMHDYRGGDIVLQDGIVIPEKDLAPYAGDRIITSDGTTLLGADDKAGIAEIVEIVEIVSYLKEHPEIKRPDIYLMFEHDEEIGGSARNLEKDLFPVDVCYTFDGAKRGEFEIENFNAAKAEITFEGSDVHPGYGVIWGRASALLAAGDLIGSIPMEMTAERTDGRKSYIEPYMLVGKTVKKKFGEQEEEIPQPIDAGYAKIPVMLLRSFNKRGTGPEMGIEDLKEYVTNLVEDVRKRHSGVKIILDIKGQYENMISEMNKYPYAIENAREAFKKAEVEIIESPIRGGTDGSAMTMKYKLPTPNIFAGGENFHSKKEFLPESSLAKAIEV